MLIKEERERNYLLPPTTNRAPYHSLPPGMEGLRLGGRGVGDTVM